jgi:IS5 family transposase
MIRRMRGQKVEEPLRSARRSRDERLRIRHWRRERFMELGFSHADANALAKSDADLHLTRDLLAAGCAPETAFRIVR